MNFETVEVTFVHLQVCLSVMGEIWKPFFLSSSLCINVGSFTSQFMNSDLWPGTHSVPCCGGWEGRLHGDSSEAPLSTHSQCFIYGPLHFWLWWLQYLSSYLNCIFKDFIQYLHAIRYELIFLFFANYFFLFVSYLIVSILAWFVAIFKTNMSIGSILGWKSYGGCSLSFFLCNDSDDSWTPRSRCWKIFAGWAILWYHPLLPVVITGPEWGQEESTFWFGELNCWAKNVDFFSFLFFLGHVHLWFECLFYAFILVCTQILDFNGKR